VLVILSSIVLGYVYGNLIKKTNYESSMILSSEYLNKRLVDNTIDKLNLLAEEKDKRGLAKLLNISDTLADNIVEFTAKPFVDENDIIEMEVLKEQLKNVQETSKNEKVIEQVINRIEIENRHAFEITVKTLNPTVISNLEIALVRFFRETEYVRKRIDIQKK
jgi:glutamate/tyrosine decarboxylase-like PLP-dependent enzyme